ncbi:MAG TPA: hypothetical protein VHB25_15800 [Gemmatimonadaceae bacterium]|nr:hypothetical protein [Gemmatimonadaceae bacterium]
MMKPIIRLASASLLLVAVAACSTNLGVENLSNPDVGRVFSVPASIEATIGSGYQTVHNALTNNGALMPEVEVLALESYSSLNNFNMGIRVAIPRLPIPNSNGSPSIFTEFSALSRGSRLMVNAIDALANLIKGGGTLGSPAQDLRAKAFGYFVAGADLGWLAMIYDSAGVVAPGMPSDSIPPLSSAQDVMKVAITYLDSAVNIASSPAASASGGFPLPDLWLGGNSLSAGDFVKLVRSYRARFRAGVARTPAQRTAVDWSAVIADAEAGISSDFMVNVGGTTGWNIGFNSSQAHVDPGWSEMSMLYFGMADTSGAYKSFIAAPMSSRNGYFLVKTPDNRWPSGETRSAQQKASTAPSGFDSKPYITNRTLAEVPGDGWGVSYYDFFRLKYIRINHSQGPYPEFAKAENDLLAAEGYIRKGDFANAAAKIDLTRVPAGLPALTGAITSASQQVPGGSACVPLVPSPSGTVSCGTIMEAMKYEKRIETAMTSFGRWWIDGRGWGDLPEGTAYEYPVPFQEMQARQLPSYALGASSGSAAAKGTYGF